MGRVPVCELNEKGGRETFCKKFLFPLFGLPTFQKLSNDTVNMYCIKLFEGVWENLFLEKVPPQKHIQNKSGLVSRVLYMIAHAAVIYL